MTGFVNKNKKKIALLLSIILICSAVLGGTLAYIIRQTPSLKNTFIAQHSGSLVISKVVEHPFGDNYVLPDDMEFKFSVSMGEDYAYDQVEVQSSDEKKDIALDKNKCFELTLKDGQSVVLNDVPVGTVVTVTEQLDPDYSAGFTVERDDYTGQADNIRAITVARGNNRLEFVNVYEPSAVIKDLLIVGGTKVFNVPDDWQTDQSKYTFEFGLDYRMSADEEWTKLGGTVPSVEYSVINTTDSASEETHSALSEGKERTFSFNDLLFGADGNSSIFDEPGTYYFRAYELNGNVSNILYDTTFYTFQVVVTDSDWDGALEVSEITSSNEDVEHKDNKDVGIEFTNVYKEEIEYTDSVRIDITKKVQSDAVDGKSPAGYKFQLWGKDEDGKDVVVAESAPTDEDGETYIILNYTDDDILVGAYTYILKEYIPEDAADRVPGITYDDSEYKISVKVAMNTAGDDIDAEIDAELIEKDETNDSTSNAALTTYAMEPPVVVEEPQEQQPQAGDDSQLLSAGSAPTRSSYSLTSAAGVNTVDDNAPDIGNNDQFTWTTDDVDNVCEVTFTNTYTADPAVLDKTITVNVELDGRAIKQDDEFEIKISGDGIADDIETVKVNSDGDDFEEVVFDLSEIEFTKAGTYEIVIEEVKGSLGGVQYDDTKFTVTVEVKDNGNGALTAEIISVTYPDPDSEDGIFTKEVEEDDGNYDLTFTNTYVPAPAKVLFEAEKVLSGKKLTEGEFEFLLKYGNEEILSASNGADGTVAFDEIEFTVADTYIYTVSEKKGNVEGMTYDGTVYTVTVTVTDDTNGKLVAVTAVTEDGVAVNEMVFTNKYTEPTVTPTPTPTPTPGGGSATPSPSIPVAPDDGSGVPPTGDNNNIGLYVTIMIGSAAAIAALILSGKQQRKSAPGEKSHRN